MVSLKDWIPKISFAGVIPVWSTRITAIPIPKYDIIIAPQILEKSFVCIHIGANPTVSQYYNRGLHPVEKMYQERR